MYLVSILVILSFIRISDSSGYPDRGTNDVTFESYLLEQLYVQYALGQRSPFDTRPGSGEQAETVYYFDAPAGLPMPLKMTKTQENRVTHIGLNLFSLDESKAFTPVAPFLERYLLNLYAQDPDPKIAFSLLASNNVGLRVNGLQPGDVGFELSAVRSLVDLIIRRESCRLLTGDSVYQFQCETMDGNTFVLEIPMDVELLAGKDRQELQEWLVQTIDRTSDRAPSPACEQAPELSSLIELQSGIYRTAGDEIPPGLRAQLFFHRDLANESFTLIRNTSFPLHTLNNFLACPPLGSRVAVDLTFKMYGEDVNRFDIAWARLLYALQLDHTIYIGLHRAESGALTGTVLFKHDTYTYHHVLFIEELDRIAAGEEDLTLEARLFSFLRADNASEIYGTYLDGANDPIPIEINR